MPIQNSDFECSAPLISSPLARATTRRSPWPAAAAAAEEHVGRRPHRQTNPHCRIPPISGPYSLHFPNPRCIVCLSLVGWIWSRIGANGEPMHVTCMRQWTHAWPPVRCCDPLLVGVLRVILDPSWHSVSNKHYSVSFYNSALV